MKFLNSPLKTIVTAGLVAGTLDISAAIIQYLIRGGKHPQIIFKYIAGAVFGSDAYTTGGTGMIICGFLFHYVIAFIFTILFFFLYPAFVKVIKNAVALGAIYGLIVWTIMNLLVVPMTKIPSHPFDVQRSIIEALILVFCIGIPISLITSKYYRGK